MGFSVVFLSLNDFNLFLGSLFFWYIIRVRVIRVGFFLVGLFWWYWLFGFLGNLSLSWLALLWSRIRIWVWILLLYWLSWGFLCWLWIWVTFIWILGLLCNLLDWLFFYWLIVRVRIDFFCWLFSIFTIISTCLSWGRLSLNFSLWCNLNIFWGIRG